METQGKTLEQSNASVRALEDHPLFLTDLLAPLREAEELHKSERCSLYRLESSPLHYESF